MTVLFFLGKTKGPKHCFFSNKKTANKTNALPIWSIATSVMFWYLC
jgi:hypothetical protein